MRYVDPSSLAVRTARQIELGQSGVSLMELDGRAVMASFVDRDLEHLLLGFDLQNSNWPMRLSFPIFLRNLVTYALAQGRSGHPYQIRIGDSLPVRLPRSKKGVFVIEPDGTKTLLDIREGLAYYTGSKRVGLYQLLQPDAKSWFAVNLFDRRESNIKAQDRLKIGRRFHETKDESVQRQIFHPFLLFALLVLIAEFTVWKYRL
jgi:hypothetical protein